MKITENLLNLIDTPNLTRQEKWLEKGYTQEQINVHLSWERNKSRESRERKKRNNEKNKELITQIKEDLLSKTFKNNHCKNTILSIKPTTDGVGFYFTNLKEFKDSSSGTFKEFYHFDNYNKKEFVKTLEY